MIGDILLVTKHAVVEGTQKTFKWLKRNVFCLHDYTIRVRVICAHSVVEYTCKKCGRVKYK